MVWAKDLLAAPSEIEGLSNVVLEGMATGLPVMAHMACGDAEVIRQRWRLRSMALSQRTRFALHADVGRGKR